MSVLVNVFRDTALRKLVVSAPTLDDAGAVLKRELEAGMLNDYGKYTGATTSALDFTKTGAFANVSATNLGKIKITDGGAGATAGVYDIASKTNDNTVVLASAPGDSADDVDFTLCHEQENIDYVNSGDDAAHNVYTHRSLTNNPLADEARILYELAADV